ncbi:MAG TPA: cysteine hydrolase family protein [Thalassobaculum sp.]
MTQALVIIDLQVGSFTPMTARHDAEGLVRRLNGLAGRVRAAGGAVVFVQHDGPEGDPHDPRHPGWRLLPGLDARSDDPVVRKTACDAFLGTRLEEMLRMHGATRLILAGCATDYCVDTTVRAALARGWRTTVPSDGHTTADRPHLSAAKIIEHHNAIWADFIAPAGPATVCPCAEVPVGRGD